MKIQLKTTTALTKIALSGAIFSTLLGTAAVSNAQAKKPPGLGQGAIKSTESALGKKLTASQKSAIISAAKAREKANADARKKNMREFRVKLAKIAGVSLAQLQAKEKAARKVTKKS